VRTQPVEDRVNVEDEAMKRSSSLAASLVLARDPSTALLGALPADDPRVVGGHARGIRLRAGVSGAHVRAEIQSPAATTQEAQHKKRPRRFPGDLPSAEQASQLTGEALTMTCRLRGQLLRKAEEVGAARPNRSIGTA
jgi:hypothetical protein